MKKLNGKNFLPKVNLFDYEGKPIDCVYQGTEIVSNDKLKYGDADCHSFSHLEDEEKGFIIWGFGSLNKVFSKQDDGTQIEVGTPVRLLYKGMSEGTTKIKGKNVKKDMHNVDVFDISDEVEKGEITQTVL